jgi:RNA polymerase sigma-70 factor (ECF subfamily)
MDSSNDFVLLLDRLRSGDEDAAWTLVYEYGPHIIAVIRRRLKSEMRARVDSQDLSQAVWKSFFVDLPGRADIQSPEQLIQALVQMAHHKLVDAYRRQLYALSRGAIREQPFQHDDEGGAQLPGRDPTPSQLAIARELWSKMLRSRSAEEREILHHRLGGQTYDDIGDLLGVSPRTARRVVGELWREQGYDEA